VAVSRADLPTYQDLLYPTLKAVDLLGGSAQAREITSQVLDLISATDEVLALTYENRPKSVLIDRIEWARSYAKLCGVLDSPQRALFVITTLGKEVLSLPEPEGDKLIREIERDMRVSRTRSPGTESEEDAVLREDADADTSWKEALLSRLHNLSPEGFEEFVMYLLRTFGLELTRVGGSGDEGIDGIGTAPLSAVLSTRVAVQAKRYKPTDPVGREAVALFQRDAAAAGAERAVLVTLARFTKAAKRAAITTTPTVDLIDGDRLCDLVRQQEIGIRVVPQVTDGWFDRFDA
jgi:restriction system protein